MTPLRPLVLVLGLLGVCLAGLPGRAAAQVLATPDDTGGPVWSDIKGDTYDQRAHFASGADRLSAKLNEQIRVLKAKRAGMTTDVKDWDLAMKEVDESRTLLTGRMRELGAATTPETWSDARDKIGEAWTRSQLAVDKMNTTVTS